MRTTAIADHMAVKPHTFISIIFHFVTEFKCILNYLLPIEWDMAVVRQNELENEKKFNRVWF